MNKMVFKNEWFSYLLLLITYLGHDRAYFHVWIPLNFPVFSLHSVLFISEICDYFSYYLNIKVLSVYLISVSAFPFFHLVNNSVQKMFKYISLLVLTYSPILISYLLHIRNKEMWNFMTKDLVIGHRGE